MAELHDALTYLGGVEWDQVPQDDLEQYMNNCFAAGELICNSLPQQPDGTPFSDSKPHHAVPNSANSHQEMHPSAARSHPAHEDHEKLQKNWGKPMKFKAQDNPLQISLYKLAGHDRHGAWFARKSVHEGLGFDKWKRAMMREFAESMSVSGGPGAGAVRGLAADRRLERIDVNGVGKLEVYQLSAQFPGPVTPRDFVPMVLSTEDALSSKSAAQLKGGDRYVPRHFMVVSKPVEHPDAPIRSGYVRGHYESVEMIREIPLSTSKPKSTATLPDKPNDSDNTREPGTTAGVARSEDPSLDDAELNPVEWTMITRSDPGGGIPRFLVDRGTPDAMIGDLHKFLNWACGQDHIPDPDDDLEEKQMDSTQDAHQDGENEGRVAPNVPAMESRSVQQAGNVPTTSNQSSQPTGIISTLTDAIESGLDSYAPTTVSNMVHQRLHPSQQEEELSDDSSDTTSSDSFMSADELKRVTTAPEEPDRPIDSVDSLSLASGDISEATQTQKYLGHHDKEVMKLTKKREKLDQQLAKKRLAEETKLKQMQEKDESEATKQKDDIEKKLMKTEQKHRREIEKLEAKKAKEERKAQEKRMKKDERSRMSLVTRERDDFRSQSDLYRRENDALREQVADLQAQNNILARKLEMVGGQDALKVAQNAFAHKRSISSKSFRRGGSSDSVPKSVGKTSENEVALGAS